MKTNYIYTLLFLVLLSSSTSCVSKKDMIYFQEIEGVEVNETIKNYEPKIQKGDILNINVSAIDATAAAPFNLYEATGIGTPKPITYLVNSDGEINIPVLGKTKVEGFTTKQITDNLTNKLQKDYIKNPIVNIRLINFKVTVLGEVKAPGTYTVLNERISIIEAIGMAGDLTIQGKRSTVKLIREQGGKRMIVELDLTNKKIFNSPYYYLAQNDVIYVAPNKAKINSSAVGANAGIIISSISALISLIAILTR